AAGIALWFAAGILLLLGQPCERLVALLVIGVLFIALAIYARPSEVRAAVTSRGARYGSNALVLTLAFIGIIGVLNFLGSRYTYRWDLTASKNYTLSDQTIKILKDLKAPVSAVAFFTPSARLGQPDVEDRLKQYAAQNNQFTYRFVDPQANPQIANDYKIQFDSTIVLERGTRRENVLTPDESGLTNALLRVSQDKQPAIYFSTGHGEHGPGDSGANGYSLLKQALETDNYKVAALDLKTVTDTLPADISALVIAGPRQPFDPQEVQRVKDYLDKSGRVFILIDPQTTVGLDNLLTGWGLELRNDLVIDPKLGFFGQSQVPVINAYDNHDITKDLTGISSFFPGIRSLKTTAVPAPNRTATALFASSDASWGETDFDSIKNQTAQFNPDKDTQGPLDLAYAAQGTGDTPARLVVIGNSTFVTNGTLSTRVNVGGQQQLIQSGNGQLFLNTISWLASQENLIALPPKATGNTQLFLTGEQSLFVTVSSSLLLPGVMLLIGALVWWRRR
ncbi:MAG: GldG family protein, partial [Chloroflexota bacterium]|nr:GldG family protein [Chloroflexota bacterium]